MELQKQKRLIEQNGVKIECYYYDYFKSPGLTKYPNFSWINDDYNLIKQTTISQENSTRLATNLFNVGQKYNLFVDLDYFIMMPKKPTSVSSLEFIISELIKIIKNKLNHDVIFINNIFQVNNYRKFWENRLKVSKRKKEIANKIHLLAKYINFFDEKNIIIIDDVVATGISIVQIVSEIMINNNKCRIKALCYGSVYEWEKIYSN